MGVFAIVVLVVVVAAAYYHYRDHFYALESATDSKKGRTFWTILALVYAIVIVIGYLAFE
jgi:uncharacterized membrane protein YidH (DUF202 family)